MELIGTIKSISNVKQITESFRKRDFVITIDEEKKYPQTIQFELHNDRTDIIEAYNTGDKVIVDFNFKGRQFHKDGETRTVNTLACWKIQPLKK